MTNIYFQLTEEFNQQGPAVALSSGQAVVHYRLAMMSKDGDWIIRETDDACARVLEVLGAHQARMRPSAPLDVRWLHGGWSSHFEFRDERGRRIRCDFVSRPPRAEPREIARLWEGESRFRVIDPGLLVRIKQTQRAKDYAVIAEVARLLDPRREIAVTTDPDRIIELAADREMPGERPAVRAARDGAGREEVVVELAREIDRLQQADRRRVMRYQEAAARYLDEFRLQDLADHSLREAHGRAIEIAKALLPEEPLKEPDRGNAQ